MKQITIACKEDGSINALGPGDEGFPEYYGPSVRICRITITEGDQTHALLVPTSARALEDPALESYLISYAEKWCERTHIHRCQNCDDTLEHETSDKQSCEEFQEHIESECRAEDNF